MDCIFCDIVVGDIPAEVVYRDDDLVAFRDINPQAPVHILIVPTKHTETVHDLEPDQDALTGKMILLANQLADENGIAAEGYRLVFNCGENGGQEVFHLHLHLLGGRAFRWPPG